MTVVVALSPTGRSFLWLATRLRELGGTLRPQHPGASDPSLARWYVLEGVADDQRPEALSALRGHPAADAARVEPGNALPG
jgi:hypothetical protein